MKKNLGVKTYIYPQPVLIIVTYNEDGTANAMTAAWGSMYDFDKIYISLSEHKTTENLLKRKAFTIGIGDIKNVIPCDYVGIKSGNKITNKVLKAGWTTVKSEFVDAPIINELPLSIECVVESFTDGNLIGKIINVVAEESILGDNGQPDLTKFFPIVYDPGQNTYYSLGKQVGVAFKDGNKIK